MGFELFINDEQDSVWESDGDANVVDRVQILTARGEVFSYGSEAGDEWVRIVINERPVGLETYLDVVEANRLAERQEKFEIKQDTSADGYVAANPETGAPVQSDTAATEESPAPATTGTEAEASLAEF
jgi:hypothetical protein